MSFAAKAGRRRVVARVDTDGRSRLMADEAAPRFVAYEATPGMQTSILWIENDRPALPHDGGDKVSAAISIHPPAGGSTFLMLTLPPDAVYGSPSFDPVAAGAEQAQVVPGIAERMEHDAPGFHRTDTIDYVTVIAGEVWLVVDDGEAHLTPGDVVVQLGSRHAWQNRSSEPTTLAVVLLGATVDATSPIQLRAHQVNQEP